MPDRVRPRLIDILKAIDRVSRNVDGMDLTAFRSDIDRQWIVERGIEIVSEASRHIPQAMKDQYREIPWRDIRDIGNRLRHTYDTLDEGILWSIVRDRLPELKPVIEAMLADLDNKKPS